MSLFFSEKENSSVLLERYEDRVAFNALESANGNEKLAMDLAEQQLRDGTASSQLITEFVKRGSDKSRLENEKLRKENELLRAKTEAIESAKEVESLYREALDAMRDYSGRSSDDER